MKSELQKCADRIRAAQTELDNVSTALEAQMDEVKRLENERIQLELKIREAHRSYREWSGHHTTAYSKLEAEKHEAVMLLGVHRIGPVSIANGEDNGQILRNYANGPVGSR